MNVKKSACIFASILSMGYGCPMFPMGEQSAKAIRKQAWQAAYSGDYEQARQKLHEAATRGDILATAYLADSYKKGSLITQVDQAQAEHFRQTFYSNPLKDRDKLLEITAIGWRIERKNKHLLGQDFARRHPWYQQLKDSFTQLRPSYERRDKFHFPLPEEGVAYLISHYTEGTLEQEQGPLLVQAIKEINSDKIYSKILEMLRPVLFTRHIAQERKDVLLKLVHDWAITHNQQQQLGEIYAREIPQEDLSAEDNSQLITALEKNMPLLCQVDQQSAVRLLDSMLDSAIEDGFTKGQTIICLLQYAQKTSPILFQRHCDAILARSTHVEAMLETVLSRPEVREGFENTPLSLNNLIEKSCSLGLDRKEEAFLFFLRKGQQELHKKFEDKITSVIQAYLGADHWSIPDEFIELVKSPIESLRVKVFQMLVEYYTVRPMTHGVEQLEALLRLDLNGLIGDHTAVAAYSYVYQACRHNNAILCLQVLWKQLAQTTIEQEKMFLHRMMTEFFNVRTLEINSEISFDQLLENILIKAVKETTVPFSTIRTFLMHANQSGLVKHLSSALLKEFKTKCVLTEETPVEERCQFLNDLLCACAARQESYGVIEAEIETLSEGIFKEYAQVVLTIFSTRQTYFEYFGNRKKLESIIKLNQGLTLPWTVEHRCLDYYNAFKKYYNQKEQQPGRVVYKPIEDDLVSAKLCGDFIFGYIREKETSDKYRLYACNSSDGYAVWASPMVVKGPFLPYVVGNDYVYCVAETKDEVVILNKIDGAFIGTINIPDKKPIKDIYVSSNGMLFILYKDCLCIVDVRNSTLVRSWPLSEDVNTNNYIFIDDNSNH
jgi:hypothetical protein